MPKALIVAWAKASVLLDASFRRKRIWQCNAIRAQVLAHDGHASATTAHASATTFTPSLRRRAPTRA